MEENFEIDEIDFDEIKDEMIEVFHADVLINQFLQVFAYYRKSGLETAGFDKMPSEEDFDICLNDLIDYTIKDVKSGEYSTDVYYFDLNTRIGRILFLKEEILKELCFIICVQYGNSSSEIELVNECVTKELKKIKYNENCDLLTNAIKNIITKNNLMKVVFANLFLCNAFDDENIYSIDYDQILEKVPEMVENVYHLNKTLFIGVNKNEIRDFISLMVDENRALTTSLVQELTSGLIAIGRSNGKI